ncbi:hypothetical protein [Niabella beijingensis]|uniref:hypothetical protein n=1 Tax=Niabella beijingensis TaxID=2872700 RepID=UPI001CBB05BE|nr:hypothetical protein [Niabella beijingensis]MBZ4188867.1 hypothetical protein [Niabella beijingensis]
MKEYKQYLLVWAALLFFVNNPAAQTTYRVGYGSASIEPSEELFSIALAGYGAPGEGRFSLEWIALDQPENIAAIAGNDRQLFALDEKGVLLSAAYSDQPLRWRSIAADKHFTAIAANNTALFVLSDAGLLYQAAISANPRFRLLKNSLELVSVTATAAGLYGLTTDGGVYYRSLQGAAGAWTFFSRLQGLKQLVVSSGRLIGLTAADELYRIDTGHPGIWTKIARFDNNGYDIKISALAIAHKRLIGLSEGKLYYSRQNTEHNLRTTALAIGQGNRKIILAALDLCGVDGSFTNRIKREIAAKYQIPEADILINASHTHFGPSAQDYSTWSPHLQKPDTLFLYGVVQKAVLQAAGDALKRMQPSTITFLRGKAPIGVNRSLSREVASYDDDLDVLKIVSRQTGKQTVLFLVGCHPVFNNQATGFLKLSGNYPSITRELLQKKYGIDNSIFIQGCAGDINPADNDPAVTAEKLAGAIHTLLEQTGTIVSGGLQSKQSTIEFPVKLPSRDSLLRFREANNQTGNVGIEKNKRWADLMLQKLDAGKVPAVMPVYVQTIHIGNWNLVGLSREVVTDYSLGIKKMYPGKLVTVAGYCNSVDSYLPTYKHIRAGTYEGFDSFYWYGQPGFFPENVFDVIMEGVKKMNAIN